MSSQLFLLEYLWKPTLSSWPCGSLHYHHDQSNQILLAQWVSRMLRRRLESSLYESGTVLWFLTQTTIFSIFYIFSVGVLVVNILWWCTMLMLLKMPHWIMLNAWSTAAIMHWNCAFLHFHACAVWKQWSHTPGSEKKPKVVTSAGTWISANMQHAQSCWHCRNPHHLA